MKTLRSLWGGALALVLLALAGTPAAANGLAVKDATGATKTTCTITISGVETPCHIIYVSDGAGNYIPALADSGGRLIVNVSGTVTTKLQDASANVVTIKPASTGAIATDTGLVVQESPNSPLITAVNAAAKIDQSNPGTTNGVVVNSSALPTGGATSANQTTANTSLSTIATNTTNAATTTNQTSQITQETAVNTILGTVTASPTANTIADRLKTINTTLGTPMQSSGGSITANAGTNLNTSALALDASVGTTNTDLGPPGATACATDNGSCSLNALIQRNNQRLTTLNTTLGSPMQATGGTVGLVAGSALAGKFGIDQTTPGTTNGVVAASSVTSPSNTPTISTSAYVSGYVLGGIQSFTGQPTTGTITDANVVFNSGTFSGSVDVFLFNANPTGGGTADHAAFALTSTDTAKEIGVFHLTDCPISGNTIVNCQSLYQAQTYTLAAAGTTIFAVAVVRGTPTFAGTTDAIFSLQVVK